MLAEIMCEHCCSRLRFSCTQEDRKKSNQFLIVYSAYGDSHVLLPHFLLLQSTNFIRYSRAQTAETRTISSASSSYTPTWPTSPGRRASGRSLTAHNSTRSRSPRRLFRPRTSASPYRHYCKTNRKLQEMAGGKPPTSYHSGRRRR
jgi:hypothetical protein